MLAGELPVRRANVELVWRLLEIESGPGLESCGDGIPSDCGGDCDDGNLSNADACLNTCLPASCGDDYVWAGVEECDDANSSTTDAGIDCVAASCGDGFVRRDVELCDDGNDVDDDLCGSDCTRRCDAADFPGAVAAGTFLGDCYLVFDLDPDIGCAEAEAETACTSLAQEGSAHLASLGSGAENDFVRDLASAAGVQVTWIGLDDLTAEGTYSWTDGTAFAYANWAAGEPTDADADPDDPNDCVSVDTEPASPGYGWWDDRPPGSTVPYVCEYAWP
jgi:cysteine-rich repeat protein